MRIGYALSSEEHDATALLAAARRADVLGFEFAMISDLRGRLAELGPAA